MYYLLEYLYDGNWLCAGAILKGDYRKHLVVLDKMREDNPSVDFRARRLKGREAAILIANGFELWTAPDNVQNTETTG